MFLMRVKLVLEDGIIFEGESFGAEKTAFGEVVFNTGMVGYPESLTDPSYRKQILVLTYPLIGNYGIPEKEFENDLLKNFESDKIQISGLVVSEYSKEYNHWNSKKSLGDWMLEDGVPGVQGVDTRKLTKILREKGTMKGKIIFEEDIDFEETEEKNLVDDVSIKEPKIYGDGNKKVVLIDCGCKNSIIHELISRDIQVIRVPWDYDFFDFEFCGVVISNGPGDPKMCAKTIRNVKKVLEKKIPIFGICFGNQILALAGGGDTYKLKYGHRSQNQPCVVDEKKCYITSQNHGYAVRQGSLGDDWEEWFINLNDGTNEGIKHKTLPFMSVQFHPEANPGPCDTRFLFDKFVELL